MKKLPLGIQTFEKIRKGNFVYVDKTEYISRLLQRGNYFFYARPRRFGKSLLLSTLKAYFTGKQELFSGLKVKPSEKRFPMVHLDYSTVECKSGVEVFRKSLIRSFQNIAADFGVTAEGDTVIDVFVELIRGIKKKEGPAVILVDEYDKPLVDLLADETAFFENRSLLQGLYGSIKAMDADLHFVMLTGVSRFAKTGVFSGMNNIEDISLDETFADMTGFSEAELRSNFAPHLAKVRDKFGFSEAELYRLYKSKYNGYSWNGKSTLYNPFSVISSLSEQNFRNYWFSTGTTSFLIDLIKEQQFLPEKLENTETEDLVGNSLDLRNFPIVPLLFQTGYLTIKETYYDDDFRQYYRLDYPNEEVRHAFLTQVSGAFLEESNMSVRTEAKDLREALRDERTEDFLKILRSFFADIPARLHIPKEAYYHSLTYMILRLVGVSSLLEKETDKGRIDAVIEFSDKIYIIKFKFGQKARVKNLETLAKQAITQIQKMQYAEAYQGNGKQVILFGIGFLNKRISGETVVL